MKINKLTLFLLCLSIFLSISCSTTIQDLEKLEIQLQSLESSDNLSRLQILYNEDFKTNPFSYDWRYSMQIVESNNLKMELLQRNFKEKHLILQLHGGGFQSPITDIYRKNAQRYIKNLPVDVLTPDYRTSPEYQYPAALDDAFTAWQWAVNNGYEAKNIVFAGDSAGGNLALALALKLKDAQLPLPAGIVLMSPFIDLTLSFDSHKRNLDVDLFFNHKRGTNPFIYEDNFIQEYAGTASLTDKFVSPYFGDFLGFPPMLIQVGTREVLEDDSLMLYKKALASQVDARITRYEGMYHVFQLSDLRAESKDAWREVRFFIKEVLEIKDEEFKIGNNQDFWQEKPQED